MIKPTYEHSLVQAGNSIRRFCHLELHHESLALMDEWIADREIKQLLVVLIDGMGYNQIKRYLAEDGFFLRYMKDQIQSVYPSTTVAATTALRTGLLPSESGWLGWHQYIPEVDDSVVMFQDKSYYDHLFYPGLVHDRFPVLYSAQEAQLHGGTAVELFPWTNDTCSTLDGLLRQANKALHEENQYVYAYWDGYDAHMHKHGVNTSSSIAMLQEMETSLCHLAQQLHDHVGMLILADHGHVDIEECSLLAIPQLSSLLKFPPTLECRAANFYIKEGYQEEFKKCFEYHFHSQFQLYTHEEVLAMGLFGEVGKEPAGESAVGDFIACAIGDQILTHGDAFAGKIKGNHAGMSEDEMIIPFILYTNHE